MSKEGERGEEHGIPDTVEHQKEKTTVVEKMGTINPDPGSPPTPLEHFEGENMEIMY